MDGLELLLAYADDQTPVLEGGLPEDVTTKAVSTKDSRDPHDFLNWSDEPNDLSIQRWAVVAPEGKEGDHLLDLIKPLRDARRDEQGADPIIYRVKPGMDADAATKWVGEVYQNESVPIDEQPRYLLILGDIDGISPELQLAFPVGIVTGRLAFSDDAGYAAYIEKALKWERTPATEEQARAMFYTSRDNTAATSIGYRALVSPSIERARERMKAGKFVAKDVLEIAYDNAADAKDLFLNELAKPDPSMLFTMSHGAGPPRGGWKSVDEQRAQQGAMSFGAGVKLTGEEITKNPFLPGGIWFFLACYGGGTPGTSAYYHWLAKLRESGGFGGRIDSVLAGLPKPGDRPFLASLPKAALANPNGPLAVIAHLDLAWTYSFQDLGTDGQDRASRFEGIFKALVDGKRAGLAYDELFRSMFSASNNLASMVSREVAAEKAGTPLPADPAREVKKGNLWMLRADLAGYMLLGDPAVRLPIRRGTPPRREAPPEIRPAPAAPAPAPAPKAASDAAGDSPAAAPQAGAGAPNPAVMEEAVIAMIKGEQRLSERFQASDEEIKRWEQAYREAGRAALAKLR